MPRGAKGWPIENDTRMPWLGVVSMTVVLGFVFPSIFSVVEHFTRPERQQRTILLSYAIGIATSVALSVFKICVRGRLRVTPTAVLWVPRLGPTRFVYLFEARRLRTSGLRYVFDTGKKVAIPMVGPLRRMPSGDRPSLRQIDDWLDGHFFVKARPPTRNIVGSVVCLLAWFPLCAISVRFLASPITHTITLVLAKLLPAATTPPATTGSSLSLLVAPCVGLGLLVGTWLFVVSVAKHAFGMDVFSGPGWRERRERHHGFEVQTAAPVASPPSSL